MIETLTSRERLLRALNHQEPDRVPIDLGGNQTGIHKFAYQALFKHLGIRRPVGHHGRRAAVGPAVRGGAGAVPRRYPLHRRRGRPATSKGGIVQNRRDGRLWHDLTDEFGVTWSMPDDQPLLHGHLPSSAGRGDDRRPRRLSVSQGRRSEPLRRAAPAGAAAAQRNALCGRQRHLGRGLRNLLVSARPGTLVHGPARPSPSSARPCWTRR